MNGPLARFVARTCHANAFLRGRPVPEFSPGNSTCQFYDSVKFFEVSKTLLKKVRETPVAVIPNAWFEHLRTERVTGIRLTCTPQNKPGISDRMSSAFVGGGGTLAMEALQPRGRSAVWLSRWEVWNQNAPERRVWRVSYGRDSEISTRALGDCELESGRHPVQSVQIIGGHFHKRAMC